jgi:hypothetical protein
MPRAIATLVVVATAGFGLTPSLLTAAEGQANDRRYCDALIQKYRTYVSDPNQGRSPTVPNVTYEVAISKCGAGDTAAGIPLLEKALRGAKIDVPQRG